MLKYVLFFCNPFDKDYILSLVKCRLRTRASSERYLRNCKYALKSCYLLHEFRFLRCIYVTTNNNNNTTSAHSRDNFSNETSSPGIGDRNPFFFFLLYFATIRQDSKKTGYFSIESHIQLVITFWQTLYTVIINHANIETRSRHILYGVQHITETEFVKERFEKKKVVFNISFRRRQTRKIKKIFKEIPFIRAFSKVHYFEKRKKKSGRKERKTNICIKIFQSLELKYLS